MNSFLFAVHDIRESFSHTQLWLWTGLQDIKLRYRRSALGPWWLTISTGILVAAMGILYAGIFKHTISDYLPNFAVSYIFWIFFSGQINESATAFTQFENILKQTRIPLLSCVLRILTRHVIILLHNALIILIAFMIFGFKFSLNLIYFLPAFFIFLLFLLSISVAVGILCTRYRDMVQLISSMLQILFFLSPILWKTEILEHGAQSLIVRINPIFYLMETVRRPLFGLTITFDLWNGALLCTAISILTSAFLFLKYRARITYWL
ncbi:ABC-type polysaccharide/polyol phosphate export system, permease component [Candidatus Glomeribacter gigasporarum BEG34]|uniref:ABC-type polysaccharide/polyol phosphate export system, permease component n=1 Tax=Candidatus Glomeribacter gigasporarum BEG34 TaxID=1070319 RepID=G2J9X2_9BURK|nr:ABC transporter permease [Candidatus Glomeribacter gigasporarum]CCD29569.1 ABC-type polysaccharide/polyol phosphate export system, permease component [Candidatus Glomeribacter gigasporarum BEG34]